MIIIVGDEPSNKNKDKNVPFVGTKSYKRLLEWIYKLDIDINRVCLVNRDGFDYNYVSGQLMMNGCVVPEKLRNCTIIALGNKAADHVYSCGVFDYYQLPHPSGRNRLLNSKKYVAKVLKECYRYIHGE